MSAARQQKAPEHIARYEELRRHAVKRQILAGQLGLTVLLRHGLAAWVEKWSMMPAPPPAPSGETSRPSPLPDDTCADVINVLAAMVLGHMQEVHV